jgi:hypothetical protein
LSPDRGLPVRASDVRADLAPDRRRFRRNYLIGNSYGFGLGLAAVAVGMLFFLWPATLAESSVGREAGVVGSAWAASLLLGGPLLTAGLWRPHLLAELMGLMLVGPACVVWAFAVVVSRGVGGVGTSVLLLVFALGAVPRARLLWRLLHRGSRRADG